MKKIFYSVAIAALTLSMTACGGNSNSSEDSAQEASMATEQEDESLGTFNVTVSQENFENGDMADYVALVPGEYTFTCFKDKAEITVKAKALGQTNQELSGSSSFGVYDENGNELGTMSLWSTEDLDSALKDGDTDSEGTITMHFYSSTLPIEELMSKAKEVRGLKAVAYGSSSSSSNSDSDSGSSSNSGSGSTLISSSELSTYVSNGKSGNIDKMIQALEWQNKTEAGLKSKVRALDEEAIKAKIALDKAMNEIGDKYDTYSLMGALNNMTDQMSNSQLKKYNSACANAVHFFTAGENSTEYNNLYRKLRYGL